MAAVLEVSNSRKVTIFVDALDEAGTDAMQLVEYLHLMNDQLNDGERMARICIACRHYPIVAKIPGLDIVVEDNNGKDISLYVHTQFLFHLQTEDDGIDAAALSGIEQHIVNKASGIFQWACLVVLWL
jgi:hypothetical protein